MFSLNGLKTVWKEENNFRIEAVYAVLLSIFIYYFNFSFVESALLSYV